MAGAGSLTAGDCSKRNILPKDAEAQAGGGPSPWPCSQKHGVKGIRG